MRFGVYSWLLIFPTSYSGLRLEDVNALRESRNAKLYLDRWVTSGRALPEQVADLLV